MTDDDDRWDYMDCRPLSRNGPVKTPKWFLRMIAERKRQQQENTDAETTEE